MKNLIPLFALTAAILTACPTPQPSGTAVPTTGGTVSSSDSQASLNAPSATAGTFVAVTASSDQGQLPSGLTFVRAYNFQVTAGSVPSATVSFAVDNAGASKATSNAIRLFRRDGVYWRYVEGQFGVKGALRATVQTYGVYGVLSGVATIKDIVLTPNPVNLTVGQTQQMTTLVRDSLNQPMPSVDSPITWNLESQTLAGAMPQALEVVAVNTISATGLFTANAAATDKIIATTNQNVEVRVPVTVTKGVVVK